MVWIIVALPWGLMVSFRALPLHALGLHVPPFPLRPTRFHKGSVQEHHAYMTTFQGAVSFMKRFEPKTAIMEQVEGFDQRFSSDEPETPKTRLDVLRICAATVLLQCSFCDRDWHIGSKDHRT